ncbi:hypothetical protein KUTeg_006147 [Tegillarca granosa]|uniref:Uncharacterized protein n=1 Tax=Tegillarca granosa TaxID=220873 RepID=A0ABQ9FFM1_TEGGR|nr:hypothetical protein KUTeg_006147 [Tegillarca granosa]
MPVYLYTVSVTDPILITPSSLQLEIGEDCTFSIRIFTADNESSLNIAKEDVAKNVRTVLDITGGSYNVGDIWESKAQVTLSRVFSNETIVTISLVPVRLEDDGLYVAKVKGSAGNDVKRFRIKTYGNDDAHI